MPAPPGVSTNQGIRWLVYCDAHSLDNAVGDPLTAEHSAARRVLLIGEDNPQSPRPHHALWPSPAGCAGHRLMRKVMGLRSMKLYLMMWRINLCQVAWNTEEATATAQRLLVSTTTGGVPWSTIVLLGRKVAERWTRVLGRPAPGPFEFSPLWLPYASQVGGYTQIGNRVDVTFEIGDRHVSVISLPHPSGRSREWNDPLAYARARKLLREVAPGMPWGGRVVRQFQPAEGREHG